jgi:hypothetical protein
MRYVSVAARLDFDDAVQGTAEPHFSGALERHSRLTLPYAAALRRELTQRNRVYSEHHHLRSRETYGPDPTICYLPGDNEQTHGNFLQKSYRAILNNDGWRRRLEKSHTSAKRALPREDRRWRELDACISSDALLMNIFCNPDTLRCGAVLSMLSVDTGCEPQFGVKARVPLKSGRCDRTEIDMRLGSLLVEAKLTENDFQSKPSDALEAYRDFAEVFAMSDLPQLNGRYLGYQLIRNVLGAHADQCSFCVMMDARRPDLREAWFEVMRAIRVHDLRLRCKMLTWQELAAVLPRAVGRFLDEKYGIVSSH